MQWITGVADVMNFEYYRLLYGKGLNPRFWHFIKEGSDAQASQGQLALWDTRELEGLYALELMVVDQEGRVFVDVHYVTIDHEKPEIKIIEPEDGERIEMVKDGPIYFNVAVKDNLEVSKVDFLIDGTLAGVRHDEPFLIEVPPLPNGVHTFVTRAYDSAGNVSESEPINIYIEH